jgi:hypothetical protein
MLTGAILMGCESLPRALGCRRKSVRKGSPLINRQPRVKHIVNKQRPLGSRRRRVPPSRVSEAVVERYGGALIQACCCASYSERGRTVMVSSQNDLSTCEGTHHTLVACEAKPKSCDIGACDYAIVHTATHTLHAVQCSRTVHWLRGKQKCASASVGRSKVR